MHNTLPSQESPAKDKATTIQEKAACMRGGEASQSQRTGSQPSGINSLPIRIVLNEIPFTSLHTPTYVHGYSNSAIQLNIMSYVLAHVYVRMFMLLSMHHERTAI